MTETFAPAYVNTKDEKFVNVYRVGGSTLLYCKRKCAYNDAGLCFYPGRVEIGVRCKRFIREEDKPAPEMPKDKEEPNSGSGYRGWITATLYGKDEDEAYKMALKYLKEYPREGYSSTYSGPIVTKEGFYYCVVKRYSTCD